MTATDSTRRRGRRARKRWIPFAAATTAAVLAAGAVVTAGGGTAGAASLPQAQSVGNFLDATLGNKPIDQLAKLQYATAQSPGQQSVQNPLDASALNGAIKLPLTGDLQLPKLLGATVGAVNQVAVANSDGASYGASGAVANSGGVSIGGNNNAYPANATIDLDASTIAGNSPIPIPGGTGSAAGLGEIKLEIGAVSALAQTPKGYGKAGSTTYQIAGLDLALGSPLIGDVLKPVVTAATGLLSQLSALGKPLGLSLPADCDLAKGQLPDLQIGKDSAGDYVFTISSDGSITLNVEALLSVLGLDLNKLPANTGLIDLLINYVTSPDGLAKALPAALSSLTSGVQSQLAACAPGQLKPLLDGLTTLLGDLNTALSKLTTTLGAGAGGANPLAPVAKLLKQIVDIGINVQPDGKAGTFKSALAATPKQGTPVVQGQIIVRAIEIDLVGDPLAVVALANAAAGPSTAPAPAPAPAPATSAAPSGASAAPDQIPTGVPAGSGTHGGGLPLLPLGLLLLALMFAGGGAVAFKLRGRLNHR